MDPAITCHIRVKSGGGAEVWVLVWLARFNGIQWEDVRSCRHILAGRSLLTNIWGILCGAGGVAPVLLLYSTSSLSTYLLYNSFKCLRCKINTGWYIFYSYFISFSPKRHDTLLDSVICGFLGAASSFYSTSLFKSFYEIKLSVLHRCSYVGRTWVWFSSRMLSRQPVWHSNSALLLISENSVIKLSNELHNLCFGSL